MEQGAVSYGKVWPSLAYWHCCWSRYYNWTQLQHRVSTCMSAARYEAGFERGYAQPCCHACDRRHLHLSCGVPQNCARTGAGVVIGALMMRQHIVVEGDVVLYVSVAVVHPSFVVIALHVQ